MVQLTRKRIFERIEDSHEANGITYSANYEQEVTYDTKGTKSIVNRPANIDITIIKGGTEVAHANYQEGNRNINNYQQLTSEESKQISNTVIDIFDTVLTQTK